MKRPIDYRTAIRFRADGYTTYAAGWRTKEEAARFSDFLDRMADDPSVDLHDFESIGLAGEAYTLAATGCFLD